MDNAAVEEVRYQLGPRVRIALIREPGPVFQAPVRTAGELWDAMKAEVAAWDRERLIVVLLDQANHIVAVEEVAVGPSAITSVPVRDILKSVILANAAGLICVHNHLGPPAPTEEDARVTEQLRSACDLIGIPLLDHVIFGDDSYYSFHDSDRI
jgi:DNA repair protein RadC